MADNPVTACLERNPYVGPRPFRREELFFGRSADARRLVSMLISSRIVLLHSPSGAGKTSLIQAAILPAFEKRGFAICAQLRPEFSALRVNAPPPDFDVHNRYVYSAVHGLIGHLVEDPAELARTSLVEALSMLADHDQSRHRQLILVDQLEEALTLDPTDRDGQKEFFRQLGETLDDERRWGLLSMREDYMGGLDRFMRYIPGRLRATYRLDFLDEDAALSAIIDPAEERGVTVEKATARKLVDDLRTVMIESPEHDPTPRAGPYVEPVLLQVVCHRLWRATCKAHGMQFHHVGPADIQRVDRVDGALRRYYAEVVREASGEDPATERELRRWFGEELITEAGFRSQKREGPRVADRETVLGTLQDRYLVRPYHRPGGLWWELSHDRLITPVLHDNAEWRRGHLEPWQVAAEKWRQRGGDDSYLLRADAYVRARLWLIGRGNVVTEIERRFLERSQRSLTEASIRRWGDRMTAALSVSVVLNVILVVLLIWR